VGRPGAPREAYGGTVEAAGKRIQAALAHFKEKKLSNVVIIGHELGAALALNAAAGSKDVRAVVALSVSSADGLNPPVDVAAAIEKLKVPVLDLVGGWDTPAQLRLAEKRVAMARTAKHPSYTQVALAGTDDMLTNVTDVVVIRVRSWINKKAAGAAIQAGAQQ